MRKRFFDQCDAVRPVRPVCCAGRFRCIRPIFRWALWGLEIGGAMALLLWAKRLADEEAPLAAHVAANLGGAGLLCALVRPFFWRKR